MPGTDSNGNGRRRTQEERSAATRAALLDATIDTLIEHGYEGTTTTRVAKRAGVSRGAHLHHFHTRAALVAAAVERLTDRRLDELRRQVDEAMDAPDRIERGLEIFWGQFSSPMFSAALDLAAVARTDTELHDALVPLEGRLNREMLALARRLFAGAGDDTSLDRAIAMALSTIRGLALLDLYWEARRDGRQWSYCRSQLIDLFERERAAA